MSAEKIVILLEIDDKGTPVIKKFGDESNSAFEKMKNGAKGGSSLLDQLKQNWIAASAAIYAAWSTISKAFSLAKMAAEYKEQEGILDNLAKKYHTSANDIINDMELASSGLIAKSDLMQVALKGIGTGLSPDQLISLAGAAEVLGDVVGQNTTEALKNLTDALETGKIKGLKEYAGTTMDLTAVFGDLEKKLTDTEKAQAMYNLIMLQATELQSQQTGAVDDTADKIENLDAKYQNATLTIGNFFKTILVGMFDLGSWLSKPLSLTDMPEFLLTETEKAIAAQNKLAESSDIATVSIHDQTKAREAAKAPYEKEIEALKAQLKLRGDNDDATKKSLAEQKKAAGEAAKLAKDLANETMTYGLTEYEASKKTLDDQLANKKETLTALGVGTKEYTDAELNLYQWYGDEVNKLNEKRMESDSKVTKERVNDTIEANEKALAADKNRLSALSSINKEMAGKDNEYLAAQKELIGIEKDEYIKLGVDRVIAEEWANDKIHDLELETAEKRAEIHLKMYDDMNIASDDYYTYTADLYESLKQDFKDKGLSDDEADAYAKQQLKQRLDDYNIKHGDMVTALKAGWDDYLTKGTTTTEDMVGEFQDMCTALDTGFKEDFADALVGDDGKFNSIEDAWETSWTNMQGTMVQKATNMVTDAVWGTFETIAMKVISDAWSGLWEGMLSKAIDYLGQIAAQEGWEFITEMGLGVYDWITESYGEGTTNVPGTDGGHPAIVHPGEMIIPADMSQQIRDAFNRNGRQVDLETAVEGLTAIGGDSFAQDVIDGAIGKYGRTGLAVGIATATGKIDPMDAAKAMTSPAALSGAFTAGLEDAVSNAFGIDDTAQKIGDILGWGAVSALGITGPVAAPVKATIALGVGLLSEEAMDALNVRAYEEFRDFLEDKYGYFEAIQHFQTYKAAVDFARSLQAEAKAAGYEGPGAHAVMSGSSSVGVGIVSGYGSLDTSGIDYGGYDSDVGSEPGSSESDQGGGYGGAEGGYRYGGIARGPESGYRATLHGVEAVVPLSTGNIPVQLTGGADSDEIADKIARKLAVIINGRPIILSVELEGEPIKKYIYNSTYNGEQVVHGRGIDYRGV